MSIFFQSMTAIGLLIGSVYGLPNAESCENSVSCASDTVKYYIDPSSLIIKGAQMFVKLEEIFFPVKQVNSDEFGIYISAQNKDDSKYGIWICPKGHPNPPWNLICSACNPS